MARSCLVPAIAVALLCLGHGSLAADHQFKMVCGKVDSVGAPPDVHSRAQLFGFHLDPGSVKQYPPGIHGDWDLGVMRDDPNAIGLAFTLAAAFSSGDVVTIWYRPTEDSKSPDTAACVMAQHKNKCDAYIPPEVARKCLAKPTAK
jgi:hypothetical protein